MATTYEEILTLFRDIAEAQKETDRQFKETDRKFQETSRKINEIAEAQKETDRQFKETDRKFQETSRKINELAEVQKETDRQFRETDRKFQETDRQIKETDLQIKETDLQIKETDLQIKETSREINEFKKLFTSQWGKLMESLVEGDLVNLLNARGIAITDTTTRLKGKRADGGNFEFDILAHNGEEVVVVEVKTTLRPDDVKAFMAKLDRFKQWLPRYASNRIYGAMAWLSADAGAEAMAVNRGLFSIRATGDSAAIQNDPAFAPRAW